MTSTQTKGATNMPTKKSAKKASSKKGGGKGQEGKKRIHIPPFVNGDPPIIVGSGGSMLVWILKGLTFNRVANPPQVTYLNPSLYDCYQVGGDTYEIVRVTVNRGQGGG